MGSNDTDGDGVCDELDFGQWQTAAIMIQQLMMRNHVLMQSQTMTVMGTV